MIRVELIVAGERFHREHADYRYRWILEQRQRLLDERRHRAEEAERKRVERIEAARQAKLDRLVKDARDWRAACDLRAYVVAVEAAHNGQDIEAPDGSAGIALTAWSAWALSEAARIDPILHGRALFDPAVNDGEQHAGD